mmetsp:Transcript_29774/g.46720  ORF Transcript_29774/g.46720 Transcript_29774/m.46720 type:complete len:144 (-) Transcript_29774:202-633(-)
MFCFQNCKTSQLLIQNTGESDYVVQAGPESMANNGGCHSPACRFKTPPPNPRFVSCGRVSNPGFPDPVSAATSLISAENDGQQEQKVKIAAKAVRLVDCSVFPGSCRGYFSVCVSFSCHTAQKLGFSRGDYALCAQGSTPFAP